MGKSTKAQDAAPVADPAVTPADPAIAVPAPDAAASDTVPGVVTVDGKDASMPVDPGAGVVAEPEVVAGVSYRAVLEAIAARETLCGCSGMHDDLNGRCGKTLARRALGLV